MADKPHGCLPSTLKRLVWGFKCLGLLCYKRSPSPAAPGRAEISVPLLLWAIFIKMFQVTQLVSVTGTKYGEGSNVGELTRFVMLMVSFAFIVVGDITLIRNGPIWCEILSECEADACLKEVRGSVKRFPMESIMNVLFYIFNLTGIFMVIVNAFSQKPVHELYRYLVFCLCFCPIILSSMLTVMLFREVLTIASSKLSVDFLRLDERRTDALGPDPRLSSLERKIHKMEFLRGKIVDYFLTAISLMMCSASFTVIFSLFKIIQHLMTDITTLHKGFVADFLFFMGGISSIVHVCYSGHYFSQHVRCVSGQLRELRMEVCGQRDMAQVCRVSGQLEELIRGQEDRAQLQYLISTLERLETFDMGSWYCLSPNTLVSVVIFIVTYLVVLLQVGGQQTHINPSTK